ncbi:ribosomal-protein-alanine N-acetyltransferase [Mucilaginibacter frigoritolerans]|jgi:[ribosomal protein S5]-alanine N-acetyltransferase|uniref:Ribosomal-protein-alanine N-acetyltransferase n=1 Tax=Mucilaginibacter frigoritolerans TaxID=652788 RepID=A0A562U579_9SPHI|nr:GNAT family N-acetyltransferase [Mucilaginibacter frigoritolerans]TWJ00904.1 ribosomal-protein-alanine N-acetyltransferase [Mucilaginibacter frigoritolerans]
MILLETERLLFRQQELRDIDAYCAMEMDPDVRRYVGGKPRTREEAENRFLPGLVRAPNNLAMWATIYKPENKYVGRCGIYPHFDKDGSPIAGEASLGLYIAKPYWSRGFATEAGRAFIEFGFNKLDIQRIVTSIQAGNDASIRVIEKLGFTQEYFEQGEYRSFYHYEIKKT